MIESISIDIFLTKEQWSNLKSTLQKLEHKIYSENELGISGLNLLTGDADFYNFSKEIELYDKYFRSRDKKGKRYHRLKLERRYVKQHRCTKYVLLTAGNLVDLYLPSEKFKRFRNFILTEETQKEIDRQIKEYLTARKSQEKLKDKTNE